MSNLVKYVFLAVENYNPVNPEMRKWQESRIASVDYSATNRRQDLCPSSLHYLEEISKDLV